MEIIIDANVATGYLRILRTGNTTLSGDPRIVFDNLNKNADQAVFDTGGHIKQEWINSTGYEWVQRKLTQLHQKGGVRLLEINDNCEVLLATLWRIGFPQKSRNSRGENIWYIRSAKIISIEKGLVVIISEDLDFFDPVKKANGVKSEERTEILIQRNGPLVKLLETNENIEVHCVSSYIDKRYTRIFKS